MARTNATRQSINNLVRNGDFEFAPEFTAVQTSLGANWIDGTATGSASNSQYVWGLPTGGSSNSANVSYDSTVSYSGGNSLRLENTDATGSVAVSIYSTTVGADKWRLIPCLPNTEYTLTCKIKTITSPGAYIRIRTVTGAGAILASANSTNITGTNNWLTHSVTHTTGATAAFIAPMMVQIANQAGTVWFDDITLSPTTPITRLPA